MRTYLGSSAASGRHTECAAYPTGAVIEFSHLASRARRTSPVKWNRTRRRPAASTALSMEENMKVIQKTKMAAAWPLLGVTVGLGTAALAQPHGPGGGEHRGMHGGFAGLGQLGLSDDQRQEVRRIMELHKAERQAIGQRLRDARRAQEEAVMTVPVDEARGARPERGAGEGRNRRGRAAGDGARGGLQRAHPRAAGEGQGAARGTRGSAGSSGRAQRQGGQPKP